MRRGGLWVSSSAWREKDMVKKLYKKALRVFREIKERACVHRFCLAKPLGLHYDKDVERIKCTCYVIAIKRGENSNLADSNTVSVTPNLGE